MKFQYALDLNILKEKDINKLYEIFKDGTAGKELNLLGEGYFANKVNLRKWADKKADKDFIYNIMRSLGILDNPEINFNDGITEESVYYNFVDGLNKKGIIIIKNYTSKFFKLRLLNYIVSSSIIKIDKVEIKESEECENIIINYSLIIEKNNKRGDYFERISIITNISTLVYKFAILCEDGFNYSDSLKIKTVEEFYKLYKVNPDKAKSCYVNERFKSWLDENKYYDEKKIYARLKTFKSTNVAVQNFLQILGYEVIPTLDLKYMDGSLVINNSGNGFLYGSIKCSIGVEADKYQWELIDRSMVINLRGKGNIKVLSNGGCEEVVIDDTDILEIPLLKKNKQIILNKPLVNFKVIGGRPDLPKISIDNDYIQAYLDDNYDIVVKRNISISNLIMKRLKNIKIESNLKIVYSDIIYYYKIILV